MTTPAPPSYAGYRFPAAIIRLAVWLYFRFPLSLRHVDEILAARSKATGPMFTAINKGPPITDGRRADARRVRRPPSKV